MTKSIKPGQDIEQNLRVFGFRITEQKRNVIKTILENPNLTCKELYYLVNKDLQSKAVSETTVYRTVKQLEQIGLLKSRGLVFAV